jgi:hypothetical protein
MLTTLIESELWWVEPDREVKRKDNSVVLITQLIRRTFGLSAIVAILMSGSVAFCHQAQSDDKMRTEVNEVISVLRQLSNAADSNSLGNFKGRNDGDGFYDAIVSLPSASNCQVFKDDEDHKYSYVCTYRSLQNEADAQTLAASLLALVVNNIPRMIPREPTDRNGEHVQRLVDSVGSAIRIRTSVRARRIEVKLYVFPPSE